MTTPGLNITITTTPAAQNLPTDTGQAFIVGPAQKGSTTKPKLCHSFADFVAAYGAPIAASNLSADVEALFRAGASSVWVQRVQGASEASASHTLLDGSSAPTIIVTASSPGAWANAVRVRVANGAVGGTFNIAALDGSGNVLELSPDFATKADAYAWAPSSAYFTLTDQASLNNPAVLAATALSGGVDDNTITDTMRLNAGALFTADLGPGHILYSDITSSQGGLDLCVHAASHNRLALIAGPDTADPTALGSIASAIRAGLNGSFGAMYAPYAQIPPVLVGQVDRTVPWTVIQAGLLAANDAKGLTVADPAAGANGIAPSWVQGLTQTVDPSALAKVGVNGAIQPRNSPPQTYGDRTLTDPQLDPTNLSFAAARVRMLVTAQAAAVLQRYVFRKIDRKGHLLAKAQGEIQAILGTLADVDAIYAATNADYSVVVTSAPGNGNTLGTLTASLSYSPDPEAETVNLNINVQGIAA